MLAVSLTSCALFDDNPPTDAANAALVGPDDDVFYQHAPRLGTVTLVTDKAGEVVSRRAASPYGVKTGHDGEDPDEFSFTGKEWDDDTGYVYFGARYYDPSLGRWNSADPLGLWKPGLSVGDRNLMAYVGNAPTSYADPYGLCRGMWSIISSASCQLEKPPPSRLPNSLSAVEKRDYETSRKVGTNLNRGGKNAAAIVGEFTPYAGDYIAAGRSFHYFSSDPSADTAINAGLDTVGAILPIVPALGTLNRIGGEVVPGTLTQVGKKFHQKELDFANELTEAGYDAKAFGKNHAGADFEIGGVKWEYKALNSGSQNAVRQRIKKGIKQGDGRVIIEGREAGLKVDDAKKAIGELEERGRLEKGREVQILGEE